VPGGKGGPEDRSGSQLVIGEVPIITGTGDGARDIAEGQNAVEGKHQYPR